MEKRAQAASVALLVILIVIVLVLGVWLLLTKVLIKNSTVFCEEEKYIYNPNLKPNVLSENFNEKLCKEDCIGFCANLSYEYQGSYKTFCRNPETSHACGCRCS